MPMVLGMDGLTVLVVADGLAVAQDLALAFRRHASITVLGPAFDEHAAREVLADGSVDVVVVDLDRSDDLGLDLIGSLRTTAPVPVVATSRGLDASTAAHVLAAGGSGLLPRDEEARRSIEILRSAAVGEVALPDGYLSSVVQHLHESRATLQRAATAGLTQREREVLTLLCEGLSTGEMAARLGVSGSTVQAHIKSVFAKLGVHSQVEAVRVAWRSGIGVPVSA
jgi:DNA-binding NarL/FixJ family response regulator